MGKRRHPSGKGGKGGSENARGQGSGKKKDLMKSGCELEPCNGTRKNKWSELFWQQTREHGIALGKKLEGRWARAQ